MEPFVKWAGGKRQLLDEIRKRMPKAYNTYYEPFLGGGAVLFALAPTNAVINDINSQLVNTYLAIRDNADEVMAYLDAWAKVETTKEYYYKKREAYNVKIKSNALDSEMAALFIYLNKHCFNGLYRVNSKGLFNVPFNGRKNGKSFDRDNLQYISEYLQHVEIYNGDFEAVALRAQAGDFVFFDSPYAPLNPTSFESYTKEGFDIESHRRLAGLYKTLDERGCYVMLTNHNTELIRELYEGYYLDVVSVKRMINSNATKRTGEEVIVTNY